MPVRQFDWKGWKQGQFPRLEAHSEAKLRVLRSYVEDYISILCAGSYGRDAFRITLVDGFAGGAIYAAGKVGSPFILLDAVATAEARINLAGRQKPLSIDCHYYFVEEDPETFECLDFELNRSKYKDRVGKSIFLMKGSFQTCQTEIVARTRQRFSRGGSRVIFFLDQCGYAEVNPKMLRGISVQLNHKAEFIINFAVDWLTDFIGDTANFRSIFPSLGLESELVVEDLIAAKETAGHDWRYLIESMVGPAFRKVAGSPFFSPFYIAPVENHRGYWLLHLAPHARARSAMLDVYWRNANGHRHFGHAGLNMLAYKPDVDQTGYLHGMAFDDVTRQNAKSALLTDFARVITDSHADGVSFKDFANMYCNQTIANTGLMAETLEQLAAENQIVVKSMKGRPKRSENIQPADIILPNNQLMFRAFNPKTERR